MVTVAATALAALALGVAGCGAAEVEEPGPSAAPSATDEPPVLDAPDGFRAVVAPTMWALDSVTPDGRIATIRIIGGGCKGFERAVVEDLRHAVRLTAYARDLVPVEDGYACTKDLRFPLHPVRLPRPLGDDPLLGACDPEPETEAGGLCRMLRGDAY